MQDCNSSAEKTVDTGKAPASRALGLVDCGKFVIASVTGLGALIYAIGYLANIGHHQMLGIPHIDYANDKIVFDGICFFLLTPVCVLLSFCTSWLSWVVLFLASLRLVSIRRMAHRDPAQEQDARRGVARLSGPMETTVVILLTILCLFLAAIVFSQRDLLLAQTGKPVTGEILFAALTSHNARLPILLGNGRSRSLYGLLFLLMVVCSLWWGRDVDATIRHRPLCRGASTWRKTLAWGRLALGMYVLLLFVVLVFCLYGFLVKSNEYPEIELQQAKADLLPSERLFLIGYSGSQALLYAPAGRSPSIWWLDRNACLPVSQSQAERNLFDP